MQAIKTEERYTLCEDGVRVDVDLFMRDGDICLGNVTKFRKAYTGNPKSALPPRMAENKSYKDGSTGFMREDGTMFFVVGGDTFSTMTFDEIIDLGLDHYGGFWMNHSLPIKEENRPQKPHESMKLVRQLCASCAPA